jgi:glutathione S-transferase
MQLYVDSQFSSPYAMSVFVALREKVLPFDMIAVDLETGAHHDPAFATTSLTQRVPTLVDDKFTLSESSAITEYLHEAYPGIALYPSELKPRARARQLQAWLRSDLMPIRQERSTQVIFYQPVTTPLSAAARSAAEKLFAAASALLVHGKDNLFGDWCIADVDLALMLNRLVLNGDAVPARLASYAKQQWQRPAVQEWISLQRPPV